MTRKITVNGVDRTSIIRLDSWTFVESAYRGEVGICGFDLDDTAAALDIGALKPVEAEDTAPAPDRFWTGYTAERGIGRGPLAPGQRQWDVMLTDINILATDYILSGGADRPAETDYARVTWLLTTVFNTVGGVSAGVVPNSNTEDMDAVDYRGRTPSDVLNECSEAAGKNWFIYHHASGPLLYYDVHTGTSLSSTSRISDVAADVDSSVTWGAAGPPTMGKDPINVYSTVRLKYKRGTVTVSDAGTLASFRRREKSITDLSIKTATKATAKANRFLAASDDEMITIENLVVHVPAVALNDIRAGQRIQIKLTRLGITGFTYWRILRREVTPRGGSGGVSDVEYTLRLTLASRVLPTIYSTGRGGDVIWEEKSNATEDDASVIIDRGGITVTNGAITVTNGTGTVIIDGSSEIFLIVNSGTLTVGKNTARGDKYKAVEVNTGLTYDPHSVWSVQRSWTGDQNWSHPLPEFHLSLDGRIINYWAGHARVSSSTKTTVRGIKFTSAPPLEAKVLHYWVYKQQAFAVGLLLIGLEMIRRVVEWL